MKRILALAVVLLVTIGALYLAQRRTRRDAVSADALVNVAADWQRDVTRLPMRLTRISNATSGNRSLLCIADFYLHPDHDAAAVQRRLTEVGGGSSYRKADTPVNVIVHEQPWGTHYKLKAYVKESREQFDFITDLTIRGKEALRAMGIRFAQAPYAETKQS